jgi:hypothetical protein
MRRPGETVPDPDAGIASSALDGHDVAAALAACETWLRGIPEQDAAAFAVLQVHEALRAVLALETRIKRALVFGVGRGEPPRLGPHGIVD